MFGELQILTLLSLRGIGPRAVERILRADFAADSADELFATLRVTSGRGYADLEISSVRKAWEHSARLLGELYDGGIECLGFNNPRFPRLLRRIPSPPVLLFCQGDISSLRKTGIAVVGTRAPSEYGRRAAVRISRVIAENGIPVVSGLAAGCDTFAHLGCLEGSGKTIAVLAHGHGRIYPQSNTELAQAIVGSGGCLVSEYLPGSPPLRGNFVARDRIQSGLCAAVIVIETDVKGGTMHTAKFCIQQQRILTAVNHPPHLRHLEKSRGNLDLITKGLAKPLSDNKDLLSLIADVRTIDDNLQGELPLTL